ncbi:MAG: hypothetical protein O3B01_27710 [Planctomycetota bacterium]|nr:hypothetical protein [Planctomycetota bacterium]
MIIYGIEAPSNVCLSAFRKREPARKGRCHDAEALALVAQQENSLMDQAPLEEIETEPEETNVANN